MIKNFNNFYINQTELSSIKEAEIISPNMFYLFRPYRFDEKNMILLNNHCSIFLLNFEFCLMMMYTTYNTRQIIKIIKKRLGLSHIVLKFIRKLGHNKSFKYL